jgi:hypothetical protein
MNLLIAVVIIGFLICWLSLRRIESYLHNCLLKLSDIESTTEDIKDASNQTASALDGIQQHFEERFPLPEVRYDPYPPLPKPTPPSSSAS